jgi:hypothetical protein
VQALDHPSFKKMIDVAARTTKGVKIPNRKATRKHIIELFKKNLDNLRIKITVSNTHHNFYHDSLFTIFSERQHWSHKSYVRCMAGWKSRRLLRSHRSLDRRGVTRSFRGTLRAVGFHEDEHCT